MVEEQLKWFTAQFPDTVIPRKLLQSHLTEVINPQVLDEQNLCLGNRVTASQVKQQSLLFTCCGSAGQKVAMNVLQHQGEALQVSNLHSGTPVNLTTYVYTHCVFDLCTQCMCTCAYIHVGICTYTYAHTHMRIHTCVHIFQRHSAGLKAQDTFNNHT